MSWIVLASSPSCGDGGCPTLFTNTETGDVQVRGYDPVDPTGQRELDVVIPAATWAHMVAQLPR